MHTYDLIVSVGQKYRRGLTLSSDPESLRRHRAAVSSEDSAGGGSASSFTCTVIGRVQLLTPWSLREATHKRAAAFFRMSK